MIEFNDPNNPAKKVTLKDMSKNLVPGTQPNPLDIYGQKMQGQSAPQFSPSFGAPITGSTGGLLSSTQPMPASPAMASLQKVGTVPSSPAPAVAPAAAPKMPPLPYPNPIPFGANVNDYMKGNASAAPLTSGASTGQIHQQSYLPQDKVSSAPGVTYQAPDVAKLTLGVAPPESSSPVAQPEVKLPRNVVQNPDGTYTKTVIDADGTKHGTVTAKDINGFKYSDEQEDLAKQRVSAQGLIERDYANRIAQRTESDKAAAERAKDFFAQIDNERMMRSSMGQGASKDPLKNARRAENMADAITAAAEKAGVDPVEYAKRFGTDNRLVNTAIEQIRLRNGNNGQQLTTGQRLGLGMLATGNMDGRDEKSAARKITAVTGAENSAENAAYRRDALAQRGNYQNDLLEARNKAADTNQQNTMLKLVAKQAQDLQSQISKLEASKAKAVLPADKQNLDSQIAKLQGKLEGVNGVLENMGLPSAEGEDTKQPAQQPQQKFPDPNEAAIKMLKDGLEKDQNGKPKNPELERYFINKYGQENFDKYSQ